MGNNIGKTLQIRKVVNGKYGITLCGGAPITNGNSCTGIQDDWIAVATDGSYDAGDIFSVWWGDSSWRTAVASYILEQGANNYIVYNASKASLLEVGCTPAGGSCQGSPSGGQASCCAGESCQPTAPGSSLYTCVKM